MLEKIKIDLNTVFFLDDNWYFYQEETDTFYELRFENKKRR